MEEDFDGTIRDELPGRTEAGQEVGRADPSRCIPRVHPGYLLRHLVDFPGSAGLMRMYTPYVGYMYTRWWLIMLIWMVYIFNYWPFKRAWLEKTHPSGKGGSPHGHLRPYPVCCSLRAFSSGFLGQFRDRLLQSRQADEAARDDGVFRPRIRIAGLPDVRGDRLLAQPGLGGGL